MLCPDCRGQGVVGVARCAVERVDGSAVPVGGTAFVTQDCRTCEGAGWLPFAGIAPQTGPD